MKQRRALKPLQKRIGSLVAVCAIISGAAVYFSDQASQSITSRFFVKHLNKNDVAQILGKRFFSGAEPVTTERVAKNGTEYTVRYSTDALLEKKVNELMRKGKIAYGAFVAIDPRTGQVLAMVSHGLRGENMNLKSTFPAASIFKIVTAAAAIENGKLKHNSLIPVRGSYHTLYKRNIMTSGGITADGTQDRYLRLISFEDALAKSVNSVFGKVGIFGVGPDKLRETAARFQFNKSIPFEIPLESSVAQIPNDPYGLAESASGFTRFNTLNPVHGALIAAAVVNDGIMMEPSIVSEITSADSKQEYRFTPKTLVSSIDKITAEQVELMMHKTIVAGTSRRAFRGMQRSIALGEVFIGGKTGTLNGKNPAGRYDWFIGFGEKDSVKIAVASLCVHGEKRGIKASQVAREALESYFRKIIAEREPASSLTKPRKQKI